MNGVGQRRQFSSQAVGLPGGGEQRQAGRGLITRGALTRKDRQEER